MNNEGNDNVFTMVRGGKNDPVPTEQSDGLPLKSYRIKDVEGDEYTAKGFLIFTSAHIAVMQDTPNGAAPVLVIPLVRLSVAAEITED